MKTSELSGALLDYWTARAEGKVPMKYKEHWYVGLVREEAYTPSSSWTQGGPIVETYCMYVEYDADVYWIAATSNSEYMRGDTPLQAICRAVVRAKFGDEVEYIKGE